MSFGIGTQFTATLAPSETQTWFTWGWDPNDLIIWSIRPISSPAQVKLDQLQVECEESGFTYWLTITNSGPWPATFEARYYFKSIIPENAWRSAGPNHLSGCIIQVCVDPGNSDRILAIAQGGGLWKLDSVAAYPALSWVSLTDQRPSLVGFAVAIAGSDSNRIYAGQGAELLKSTDGGSTWTSANPVTLWSSSDPWSHSLRRIAVDPGNADRVLLASDTGLWQTPDAGATWQQTIAGDVTDLAIDPDDPSIVYVTQRPVGVLKLQGSAAPVTILPWSSVSNPQNTMLKIALGRLGTSTTRTVAVKFDQIVFVNNSSGTGAWSQGTLPPDAYGEQQGDWNNVIAVDPFDNNVILAGTQELFRSNDGGTSWTRVASYYAPHEDQQSVVFDTVNPGVVYLSNDGGVFRSSDGGQTWMSGSSWSWKDIFGSKFDLNFSLVTSLFYRTAASIDTISDPIGVGPAHHQGLLASGSLISSEWDGIQGHSWEMANTYGFPQVPGTFFLVQGPDLWRQLYPQTGTPNDLITTIPGIGSPHAVMIDNTPGSSTIFVGTQAGNLYYTTTPTANPPPWTSVTTVSVGEPIVSICFAPSQPGMAYLVTQSGRVWRNDNVASVTNWIDRTSNWALDPVVQVAVDSADALTLYLISGSRIAKSSDGGSTWTAIAGADATTLRTSYFQSILADPGRAGTVYASGNPGVFVSTDSAQTWANFGDGLPNASTGWLQWLDGNLVASTWGRGLWLRQPFANYAEDNVNIDTQFTGTLAPGETQYWFTWGWPQNWFVDWSIRPTTNQGFVSLDSVDVELEPSGFTYHLTISNTGSQPAAFEAKYAWVSF
jgi:photosystem II stability/assembly factor-like uncharacterized protein